MPGRHARAGQVDRLLPGEANQPGHVGVHEGKPRTGAPVAEQPRLDVLNAERPFQQGVVFQIDLADRQVVAGAPPSIDGGQLVIGQVSSSRRVTSRVTPRVWYMTEAASRAKVTR